MKKTLSAPGVKRIWPSLIASTSLLLAVGGLEAQPYGQVPQSKPKSRTTASYAPIPPSYAAAASKNSSSSRPLEARVAQLAQNDQHQDVRLHHLERDVSSLKPAPSRYVTEIQGEPFAGNQAKLYTVRSGDTLWRIAAKYSTSINAIRAANRISGDTVAVGQTLMIPLDEIPQAGPIAPGIHVVSPGETFSGLAQKYRVTQDALAKANPSAYPDRLLVGERLTIPGARRSATPTYAPVMSPAPRVADNSSTHTVRAGESLGAIAKKYGVSTARLAAANKLKNPDLVEVGQRLVVPAAVAAPQVAPTPPSRLVKHSFPTAEPETTPLPGAGLPSYPSAPAPLTAPAYPKPMTLSQPAAAPDPVPAAPTSARRGVVAYRLEPGDDLNTVANMFSTTPAKIRELNILAPDAKLKAGDEVVVPALGPLSVD